MLNFAKVIEQIIRLMKRIISIVLMAVAILLYPVYVGAEKHDTVTLKNGRVLTGKIVSYMPREIVKISDMCNFFIYRYLNF